MSCEPFPPENSSSLVVIIITTHKTRYKPPRDAERPRVFKRAFKRKLTFILSHEKKKRQNNLCSSVTIILGEAEAGKNLVFDIEKNSSLIFDSLEIFDSLDILH